MTISDNMPALHAKLEMILAAGLARGPLAHADQVAEIAGVLHDAFEPEGFACGEQAQLSVLGTAAPAARAARIDPLDALRAD
jgi:hypothetical protein